MQVEVGAGMETQIRVCLQWIPLAFKIFTRKTLPLIYKVKENVVDLQKRLKNDL